MQRHQLKCPFKMHYHFYCTLYTNSPSRSTDAKAKSYQQWNNDVYRGRVNMPL